MTDTAQVIDEILIAMTAAGMKQCDLARALDVSDARISLMLRPRCNLRADTIERVYKAINEYKSSPPKERDWQAVAAAQAVKLNAMRAKNRRLTIKVAKLETLLTGGEHEETVDDRRCRHGNSRHHCTGTCRGSAMPDA